LIRILRTHRLEQGIKSATMSVDVSDREQPHRSFSIRPQVVESLRQSC
jgi:hypothetical protein